MHQIASLLGFAQPSDSSWPHDDILVHANAANKHSPAQRKLPPSTERKQRRIHATGRVCTAQVLKYSSRLTELARTVITKTRTAAEVGFWPQYGVFWRPCEHMIGGKNHQCVWLKDPEALLAVLLVPRSEAAKKPCTAERAFRDGYVM